MPLSPLIPVSSCEFLWFLWVPGFLRVPGFLWFLKSLTCSPTSKVDGEERFYPSLPFFPPAKKLSASKAFGESPSRLLAVACVSSNHACRLTSHTHCFLKPFLQVSRKPRGQPHFSLIQIRCLYFQQRLSASLFCLQLQNQVQQQHFLRPCCSRRQGKEGRRARPLPCPMRRAAGAP